MRPALIALGVLAGLSSVPAPALAQPSSYAVGGVTADFSSMFLVDAARIERNGSSARTALLQVPRRPLAVDGKTVLYSTLEVVIDCAGSRMSTLALTSYGPGDAVVLTTPTPPAPQPIPAGSSIAASAAVACSGRPRVEGPRLGTRAEAAAYARGVLEKGADRTAGGKL